MASESAIAARIRSALAENLKRDVRKIRPGDDLRTGLGVDSLDMVELLFKLEESFDLEIPNADVSEIKTVGDVIAYIEQRVGTPAAAPASPPAAPAGPQTKVRPEGPGSPKVKAAARSPGAAGKPTAPRSDGSPRPRRAVRR